MWALIIGGGLAVAALAVTLLPFLRSRVVDTSSPVESPYDAEAARAQRDAVYRALETLQLERELGQVDVAEYQRQAQQFRRQAALLVREQERQLALALGDAALEREVLDARARLQRMEDEAS